MHELIEVTAVGGEKEGIEPCESCRDISDPAEVLVELARRGEIDPWDIDIARTTERFLEFIDRMERQDLRIPARILLYAAILLRMKSDSMEEPEEIEEPEPEELREEVQVFSLPQPPVRRRTRRPVTLEELISELKMAERVERRRPVREKKETEAQGEEIQDLSHEEGIEERIEALGPFIVDVLGSRERVEFKEIEGDRVLNYLALLFMAHRKELWLKQEEMWGELWLERHPGDVVEREMEGKINR